MAVGNRRHSDTTNSAQRRGWRCERGAWRRWFTGAPASREHRSHGQPTTSLRIPILAFASAGHLLPDLSTSASPGVNQRCCRGATVYRRVPCTSVQDCVEGDVACMQL